MNRALTVVTVVRNDLNGLTRTGASIEEQEGVSASDVEWLIVDGSDEAWRVSEEVSIAGSGVATRVVYQEPRGIYAAMNQGLHEAIGEFVLFLNAGDALASTSALSAILETVRQPGGVSWAVGRIRVVELSGRVVESARWNFREERLHSFARGVFPPHQATVVRTEVLRGLGGFSSAYSIAADYHAALRMSLVAEPVMMNEVIAEFHEGGTSTVQWKRASKEFHRARVEVFYPSGRERFAEFWHTWNQFMRQFLVRDVLRRDQ